MYTGNHGDGFWGQTDGILSLGNTLGTYSLSMLDFPIFIPLVIMNHKMWRKPIVKSKIVLIYVYIYTYIIYYSNDDNAPIKWIDRCLDT